MIDDRQALMASMFRTLLGRRTVLVLPPASAAEAAAAFAAPTAAFAVERSVPALLKTRAEYTSLGAGARDVEHGANTSHTNTAECR